MFPHRYSGVHNRAKYTDVVQCCFSVEDVEHVLSIHQRKYFSAVVLIDVSHGVNSGLNSSCLTSTKLQCAYGLLDVTTDHCEDCFTYDSPCYLADSNWARSRSLVQWYQVVKV